MRGTRPRQPESRWRVLQWHHFHCVCSRIALLLLSSSSRHLNKASVHNLELAPAQEVAPTGGGKLRWLHISRRSLSQKPVGFFFTWNASVV